MSSNRPGEAVRRAVYLLAWWFATIHGTHGPFRDETDCYVVRKQFDSFARTTTCWWDGRP